MYDALMDLSPDMGTLTRFCANTPARLHVSPRKIHRCTSCTLRVGLTRSSNVIWIIHITEFTLESNAISYNTLSVVFCRIVMLRFTPAFNQLRLLCALSSGFSQISNGACWLTSDFRKVTYSTIMKCRQNVRNIPHDKGIWRCFYSFWLFLQHLGDSCDVLMCWNIYELCHVCLWNDSNKHKLDISNESFTLTRDAYICFWSSDKAFHFRKKSSEIKGNTISMIWWRLLYPK